MHAALLAVVVEKGLHGGLHGFDLDAAHARHHLRHFQQLFAQVTNPPLDAIREELVTSVFTGSTQESDSADIWRAGDLLTGGG